MDLDPGMIERAATALADEDGLGYLFRGRYPTREVSRESFRESARLALTAALEGCEIDEQWGVRVWIDGPEPAGDLWFSHRDRAEDRVRFHDEMRAKNPPEGEVTERRWMGNALLLRRFSITTAPPEEATG